MAQETDLNIIKFGSTYSATKQEALKSAIEGNAADIEEVFAVFRQGGQGAGLGTGTMTGDVGDIIVSGTGTLFQSELTNGDSVFVNGITVGVTTIINDTAFQASGFPSVDFTDAQFSF